MCWSWCGHDYKEKVRDGIISNVEVSIDLTSHEMPDISELQKLGGGNDVSQPDN